MGCFNTMNRVICCGIFFLEGLTEYFFLHSLKENDLLVQVTFLNNLQ